MQSILIQDVSCFSPDRFSHARSWSRRPKNGTHHYTSLLKRTTFDIRLRAPPLCCGALRNKCLYDPLLYTVRSSICILIPYILGNLFNLFTRKWISLSWYLVMCFSIELIKRVHPGDDHQYSKWYVLYCKLCHRSSPWGLDWSWFPHKFKFRIVRWSEMMDQLRSIITGVNRCVCIWRSLNMILNPNITGVVIREYYYKSTTSLVKRKTIQNI